MSYAYFAAPIETSEPSIATRIFEISLALCIKIVLDDLPNIYALQQLLAFLPVSQVKIGWGSSSSCKNS
jgi:hypothetical protein